jgi:hypothetical protein
MSTSAGQEVTLDEASSTTYQKQASPTSANAMTNGVSVLALGTTSGTTITATQIIVQPTGGAGSAAWSAAGVIPFQLGAPRWAFPARPGPSDSSGSRSSRSKKHKAQWTYPTGRNVIAADKVIAADTHGQASLTQGIDLDFVRRAHPRGSRWWASTATPSQLSRPASAAMTVEASTLDRSRT